MVKICKKCGKEFTVKKYPNRRYCTPECNPWIGTLPKHNNCLNCGKKLEKKSNYGPPLQYCGDRCRWTAYYNRHPEEYTKKCNHCGDLMPVNKYGYLANHCSPECRAADSFHNQERRCVICGKVYKSGNPGICCSVKCRVIATKEKLLTETRICKNCGKEFTPTNTHQQCCGKKCSDKNYAMEHPDYAASKRHRYRARKINAKHEEFMVSDVYERDNWHCQICGKPVNKKLKHPHLLSASLDHILPLSRGGDHTLDNVRLSHLRCNISRGNRDFMAADNGQIMFVGRF